MLTKVAELAFSLALVTGWKWPRRVEAWAWNKTWEAR